MKRWLYVLACVVAACGSAVASPSPAPPVTGLAWGTAPAVERPDVIEPAPMPSSYLHPGHFTGQAYMADVAAVDGGWLAVGYLWPGWRAVAWRSPDALTWRLVDPHESDGTFMTAIAAGPDLLVAVGRDAADAAAWTSPDGSSWARVRSPLFVGGERLRMSAVAAVGAGFVAGGAAGPELGPGDARFWFTPDGRTWIVARVDDGADASVTSIVATGTGLVAVGRRGTEREPSGSIAWTSPDGRSWTRVPDSAALRAGQMVAVTIGGPGLVAVGADADERATIVWLSSDGQTWERVSSPTFAYHGGKIRMTDVAAGGPGLVAVGNAVPGIQYGSARVWISADGRTWSVAPDTAAFGQGEMLAVAARPGRIVAVGTFGAPDNYVPSVWLSPPAP